MICHRCRKETQASRGSIFDTQQICMECYSKEKRHPDHEHTRATSNAKRCGTVNERKQVRARIFNITIEQRFLE